jgi:tetratricopeptide (TPR) repeat protein
MNLSDLKLMSILAITSLMLVNCTPKKEGGNVMNADSLRADSIKKAEQSSGPVLKTAEEYSDRGSSKSDSGDYAGAVKDYDKAIEMDPNNSDYYLSRGYCKLNMTPGDNQGAIEDFTKGLSIDSTESLLYWDRAIAYGEMKNYPSAIADYGKAIEVSKDNSDNEAKYRNLRGKLELQTGDVKAAIKDFKIAKNLKPSEQEYSDNLKEAESKK